MARPCDKSHADSIYDAGTSICRQRNALLLHIDKDMIFIKAHFCSLKQTASRDLFTFLHAERYLDVVKLRCHMVHVLVN